MIAQISAVLIGAWLMASPAVLGYGGAAATIAYVAGPLIATVACIACSEVMRPFRWLNVVLGASLALSVFAESPSWIVVSNHAACGLVCFLSSLRGGRVESRFGGGWSAILTR